MKLQSFILAPAIIMSFVLTPIFTHASNFDQAFNNLQSQLFAAYYSGDTALTQELFLVMIELLSYQNTFGGGSTFSGNGDIEVSTERATKIGEEEAQLNGEIELYGDARAYVWFEYGEERDELEWETSREYVTRDADVEADLDDLDEDERYYFRLVAEDRDTRRITYGNIEDFRTDDDNDTRGDVDVDTLSPDDITDEEVVFRGKVVDGRNVEVWFAFDEDDKTPSCSSDSQREDPDGDDEYDEGDTFKLEMDSLDEDTKYYYRACAEDEDGDEVSGSIRSFTTDDESQDDEPFADTEDADDITDESAELSGSIDMNDFNNGRVFFVWGEDEDLVDEIEDEYEEYADIEEESDDLQKKQVDSDLDHQDDYSLEVDDLDDDTDHFFAICVEYEEEDSIPVIICGNTEEFTTEN